MYMRGKASLYWEPIIIPTKRFHMTTSTLQEFIPRSLRPSLGKVTQKGTFCVYSDRFPLSGYQPLPLAHLLILLMDSIWARDRGFPNQQLNELILL